jgi:hypothetical protein
MQDMRELFDGQPGNPGADKSEKKLPIATPTTDLPA